MTGRIFITGDKHGTFSPFFGLAEKNDLHPSDILLIAGDASYVWDADYRSNITTLQQIFPGTIAFVDGNHENHVLLNGMTVETWNGGKTHQVGERVYHLMRGEVYSIYDTCIFTFGGARSVDVDRRVSGLSWWREEEPTAEELEYGRQQLTKHLDRIEYVITHETPLFARASISRTKVIDPDYSLPAVLDSWYEMIANAPRFQKWYFGHMHVDQIITPQLRAIHSNILPLGEETRLRWG